MTDTTSKVREHYSAMELTDRIKSALAMLAPEGQQRSGHIIEISPEGSPIPSPGLSGYHISKDAIEDFTLDLAQK